MKTIYYIPDISLFAVCVSYDFSTSCANTEKEKII